jgi:D-amino-acid dehydrogenase
MRTGRSAGRSVSDTSEVLVIRPGILGICVAWHLRRRGFSVVVADCEAPMLGCGFRQRAGAQSSCVVQLTMPGVLNQAFGMLLDPGAQLHVPLQYCVPAVPWLARFLHASRRARLHLLRCHRQASRLAARGRCAELIRQIGQLHLDCGEAQLAKHHPPWSLPQRHGLRIERLCGDAILVLESEIGLCYAIGC